MDPMHATAAEERARLDWRLQVQLHADKLQAAAWRMKGIAEDVDTRGASPATLQKPYSDARQAMIALEGCWTGPNYGPDEQDIAGMKADAAYDESRNK